MPQYNNQYSYEALQKLKLSVITDELDKREGSVIWNTISANSYALSIAFTQMGLNQVNMFPDTASRKFLIRHCAQRGITPRAATYPVIKGQFFTSVVTGSSFNPSIGTRFTVENTSLVYVVTKQVEDGIFELTCETPGTAGNLVSGTLIPVEEIQALGSAVIIGIVNGGEDEEDTESLRKRYMDSLEAQSFAGNKAAYKEFVTDIDNVGSCKVYRAYNGTATEAGHVSLYILDGEYGLPTADLVATVQEAIDPTQDGEGLGYAPIDHIVHVFAATETAINVSVKVTPVYDTATWDDVYGSIVEVIDSYFMDLKTTWDSVTSLVVRPSQIIARLLDVEAILDVTECLVNNASTNVQLGVNEVPKVGDVSGEIIQSA